MTIRGIDHVVICVHDLDEAHATFARLGFTLTPRGHHSVGTENHCIMLGEDYIELLAVPPGRPHPTTRYYADFLIAGEGLAAFALAADSASAAASALRARGFATSESALARPVEFDGVRSEARFDLVFLDDGQTPGARTFVCVHRTRELVWRPSYRVHANSARAIRRVELIAATPTAVAARYAQVFGVAASGDDDDVVIAGGTALLGVANDRRLARRYPNLWVTGREEPAVAVLTISVDDRAGIAAHLAANDIAYRELPGGAIGVGAETAHGIALVFD